ncbi:hypothetical protein SSX86_032920, partial [Deinandra increscens subsp. villosa]
MCSNIGVDATDKETIKAPDTVTLRGSGEHKDDEVGDGDKDTLKATDTVSRKGSEDHIDDEVGVTDKVTLKAPDLVTPTGSGEQNDDEVGAADKETLKATETMTPKDSEDHVDDVDPVLNTSPKPNQNALELSQITPDSYHTSPPKKNRKKLKVTWRHGLVRRSGRRRNNRSLSNSAETAHVVDSDDPEMPESSVSVFTKKDINQSKKRKNLRSAHFEKTKDAPKRT